MNKLKRLAWIGLFLGGIFTLGLGYAETQPKFTLSPTTPTTVNLPANGSTTVQYIVTNKTKLTRTLTMVPIAGVSQVTSGTGACANPFVLAHNQSCTLTLQLTGSQLPATVTAGPVICKTKSKTDTSPDPFLCSQPSEADSLHITRLPNERTLLSVSPRRLSLEVDGASGTLVVTNHSTTVTAKNVAARLLKTALATNLTQDSTDCLSITPGNSCELIFTPLTGGNAVTLTPFPIIGTNTRPVGAAIEINQAGIAVITATNLTLEGTTPGLMTITNTTGNTATNISADLTGTDLEGKVTQDSSGCATLSAYGTCTLEFTANTNTAIPPTAVLITGTNASETTATISVNGVEYSIAVVSAQPLELLPDGTTTGKITLQNTSTVSLYNINSDFTGTALAGNVEQTGSTCTEILPGATCDLTFTPGLEIVGETSFPMTGFGQDGTSVTVSGSISIGSYFAYISDFGITPKKVYQCKMNVNTGIFSNCISVIEDMAAPYGMVIDSAGKYLYIADNASPSAIRQYDIDRVTGSLSNPRTITVTNDPFRANSLSINKAGYPPSNPAGSTMYVTGGDLTNITFFCSIDSANGTLSNCKKATESLNSNFTFAMNTNNVPYAFITGTLDGSTFTVYRCTVDTDQELSNFTSTFSFPSSFVPWGLAINTEGTTGYVTSLYSSPNVKQCTIDIPTGLFTSCVDTISIGTGPAATAIVLNADQTKAYVIGGSANYVSSPYQLAQCSIDPVTKSFTSCVNAGAPSLFASYGLALWQEAS